MTRQQWDDKTLTELKQRKYTSYWWVTDNKFRASAVTRLEDSGLVELKQEQYPNYRVVIKRRRTK